MTNSLKIMTQKSGYIEFGIFLDKQQANIHDLLFLIRYAHRAYEELPQILPIIAEQLDKEIIAASIFGTTSIEGEALENEEEVASVLALPPEELKTIAQHISANMKKAYDYARAEAQRPGFILTEEHIKRVHSLVTQDVPHPRNTPGYYRDNPRDVPTYVGHERVGGVYRPPKTLHDIETLMSGFIKWIHSDEIKTENPLIIAPIAHFYFELIHPFWDGNGRVGRVLETMILKGGHYHHAPFLMAKHYKDHLEEYFALFNTCRRAMERKDPNTHYPFVKFFLEGFLAAVEETKRRVIAIVGIMASRDYIGSLLALRKINKRQHAILLELLHREPISRKELELQPWYCGLYHNLTPMTRYRDLSRLLEADLLSEKNGKLVVFRMT